MAIDDAQPTSLGRSRQKALEGEDRAYETRQGAERESKSDSAGRDDHR